MSLPVNRAFIHHEGAGAPADGKILHPYTLIIGKTEWHTDGDPTTDYATKGFNHVSLGLCYTGNRHPADTDDPRGYPITDNDLVLTEQAFHFAKINNWITASPIILPHRLTPGLDTGTVCPGNRTMARWPDVVAAVWSGLGTPPITPPQEDDMKEAIVYPVDNLGRPTILPTGPMAGKVPTCHGFVGSHVLTVLSDAQYQRLKPALGNRVPVPLDFWLDDGEDRHVYVRNAAIA